VVVLVMALTQAVQEIRPQHRRLKEILGVVELAAV
jgi:hypothetical protein